MRRLSWARVCATMTALPTLVVVALLASGCGQRQAETADASAAVVATTSIWADVVANVACDGLTEVTTLVPPGADPHGFEPSLADRGDLEAAALVVSNGLGLEEGVTDTLQAVEAGGTPVLVLADNVDTLGTDPHIWFDPLRVAELVPVIADELVNEAGLDAADVDRCAEAYETKVRELDAELTAAVATIPPEQRALVTNHDSLGYLADRYGFEVVGTVLPAPGLGGANAAQLEELAQTISDGDITVVFTEDQHANDDAHALADRVGGVEVVVLRTGSLGEAGDGADTYVGFMRSNIDLIVEALG